MRTISKPTTAKCTINIYMMYLLSDPMYTSCTRLSEILRDVSHDSINRFLGREKYNPKDMYDEVSPFIDKVGGVLSIDDSVLDKPYSDPKNVGFLSYFWSGKHHRALKGMNLITLFHTDKKQTKVPVNYRIYDKKEDKTKNDYYREMLEEVIEWGLQPQWITGDAWYSSLKNLKHAQKLGLNFLFGIESNRLISEIKGKYVQVCSIENWPEDGKKMYLKDFGDVKIFKQTRKNVSRYYVMSDSKSSQLDQIGEFKFEHVHSQHWGIECFHRAIKQNCNIERFQVRTKECINTHIYCSLRAFIFLELLTMKKIIDNWYQLKRTLFLNVIRNFIKSEFYIKESNMLTFVNA